MRRVIINLFSILVCLAAVLFDVAKASGPTTILDATHIATPTTWTNENSPYLVKGTVYVEAELKIEPGVIVKFEYRKGNFLVSGKLNAAGAKGEKIIFTSGRDDSRGGDTNGDGDATVPASGDWPYIYFVSRSSSAEMSHVSILYAGYNSSDMGSGLVISSDNVSLTKSDVMYTRGTGIKIICALPTIEGNIISKNYNGIHSHCSNKFPVVRNNAIFGNSNLGASILLPAYGPPIAKMDARYNWWGDASGPKHSSNPGGTGDMILDGVEYEPWLSEDPTNKLDPVIIIPGIMGSWEVNGEWKIDPIMRSYENLKKAMDDNGYTPGENMFDFPYQWRNSNIENAKLLRDAIITVKEISGKPKVDLVAHSMGGLLAREYIESDYYQDDVDQLITLGTPHKGAPKAYLMWEAGESDSYLEDKILELIFNREAKKANYKNLLYYIRDKVQSIRELLPTYGYLYDLDLNIHRFYPDKYPRNNFLENLNSDDKIDRLQKVKFENMYGKTSEKLTIGGYNVIDAPAFGDYWKDGYPIDFNLPWSSDGFTYVTGDGTVPEISARHYAENQSIEINGSHNEIPTEAQQNIIELLTGKRPTNKITSEVPEIKEILLVQVYCPIDITVIDPDGKVIGRDKNEIEGAIYINNNDNEEFMTIPNPKMGQYQIITHGTGEGGSYNIEVTDIKENINDQNRAEEQNAIIRGITQPDEIIKSSFEIAEDEVAAIDIQSIRKNVEHYATIGYIKNAEEIEYYFARLNLLEKLIGKLESEKENSKQIRNMQKELNSHIEHLIDHLQKSSPESIDQTAAEFLILDLSDFKKSLISK